MIAETDFRARPFPREEFDRIARTRLTSTRASGPIAVVQLAVVVSDAWPSTAAMVGNGTPTATAATPSLCPRPRGRPAGPRCRPFA